MAGLKGNYTDLQISNKIHADNYFDDYFTKYEQKDEDARNKHNYKSLPIFYKNVIAYRDILKGSGSFTNRFENTGIPCYYKIEGTYMSIPTGTYRYTYISPVLDPKQNEDIDIKAGNIYMDNLENSSHIDMISSKDAEKMYYYYKEYELTGERVLSGNGTYQIGTQKHGTKDDANFAAVATGLSGSGNFDIAARVNKPNKDPGHVWVIYTGNSIQKLERRWNDSPKFIKLDIVKGMNYDNPIASMTLKNQVGEDDARGLDMFSRQTAACKPITMSTQDNFSGETKWVSEGEYKILCSDKFKDIRVGNCKNVEGFADYKQVRIKMGNGYILISGLLLMYLLYRFTQRNK
jgi:hypothetical protein